MTEDIKAVIGGVRMGINVDIKRFDGRIHSAVVSGIDMEKSVSVEEETKDEVERYGSDRVGSRCEICRYPVRAGNFEACHCCDAVRCAEKLWDRQECSLDDDVRHRAEKHNEYIESGGEWEQCATCEKIYCPKRYTDRCWRCWKYGDVFICCNLLRGNTVCGICAEEDDREEQNERDFEDMMNVSEPVANNKAGGTSGSKMNQARQRERYGSDRVGSCCEICRYPVRAGNFEACHCCDAVRCSEKFWDRQEDSPDDDVRHRAKKHNECIESGGEWEQCDTCEKIYCPKTYTDRCWRCWKYGDILICCNLLRDNTVCAMCAEEDDLEKRNERDFEDMMNVYKNVARDARYARSYGYGGGF